MTRNRSIQLQSACAEIKVSEPEATACGYLDGHGGADVVERQEASERKRAARFARIRYRHVSRKCCGLLCGRRRLEREVQERTVNVSARGALNHLASSVWQRPWRRRRRRASRSVGEEAGSSVRQDTIPPCLTSARAACLKTQSRQLVLQHLVVVRCLALTLSVDSDDSQSLDPAAVGVRGGRGGPGVDFCGRESRHAPRRHGHLWRVD
jgi:hypothetical protein